MPKELTQESPPLNPDQSALILDVIKALSAQGIFGQQKSKSAQELEDLQADELRERTMERKEAKEMQRRSREEGAKAQEMKRQQDIARQDSCAHMLQLNGGPAIAGQRDHNRNYMFLCQFCRKEWLNGELPQGLRIPLDRIGGPDY